MRKQGSSLFFFSLLNIWTSSPIAASLKCPSVVCYCLYYLDPAWLRPQTSFGFLFVEVFYQAAASPGIACAPTKTTFAPHVATFDIASPFYIHYSFIVSHLAFHGHASPAAEGWYPVSFFCSSFHNHYLSTCGIKKNFAFLFFSHLFLSSLILITNTSVLFILLVCNPWGQFQGAWKKDPLPVLYNVNLWLITWRFPGWISM